MFQQVVQVFWAIAYIGCAFWVCLALYLYVADAVAQRSFFPASSLGSPISRLGTLTVMLLIFPREVLREYHVPESVAFVLDKLSIFALLLLFVLGIKMIVDMLRGFNRAPRNSSS